MKFTSNAALAVAIASNKNATESMLQMFAGVVVSALTTSHWAEKPDAWNVTGETIKRKGNAERGTTFDRQAWDNYAPKAVAFARKVASAMGECKRLVAARDADNAQAAVVQILGLFSDLKITNPSRVTTWVKKPDCTPLCKGDLATFGPNASKVAKVAGDSVAATPAQPKAAAPADAGKAATATKQSATERHAAMLKVVANMKDISQLQELSAAISKRLEALAEITQVAKAA